MTRSEIEVAVVRNEPFEIHMADGKIFYVPHGDYIGFHTTATSIVFYGNNRRHYLNLDMITEISFADSGFASET